jgi:ornithine cyclodeaminase/alanine dehydrogenase-like protein (mu-crystallin family)
MVTIPDPVNSFRANVVNSNANTANANANASSSALSSSLSNTDGNGDGNGDGDGATIATTSSIVRTTSLPSMEHLSVGFLGCGTIASSIARGLSRAAKAATTGDCVASDDEESPTQVVGNITIQTMVVSKRSASKSRALCDDLSSGHPRVAISVADTNQEILEACDLIFLTVLPQQAADVLRGLEFDPNRHVLVSLVVSGA